MKTILLKKLQKDLKDNKDFDFDFTISMSSCKEPEKLTKAVLEGG